MSDRAPFFAEVDIVAASLPAPRRVWGSDVSESGIFLQTTQPFRVGDRVSLRFDLEEHEVHVRAAEVMWVRAFEPIAVDGRLPGVGLKFVALDPPARAALRRFVQPTLSDTQPTQEMLSLPPFSQPPLNISMPEDEPLGMPEEVRVFKNTKPWGTPRPVTIGPKTRSDPPMLLAGWTFRKDESFAPAEATLDMRFDDARPSDVPAPHKLDESPIFDVTSNPPAAALRDGENSAPPVLDKELSEGRVAVLHLPVGEPRKTTSSPRKQNHALAAAVALLAVGTLVGSGVGYATKRWHRHEARIAATVHKHPAATHAAPPSSASTPATLASATLTSATLTSATSATSATSTTLASATSATSANPSGTASASGGAVRSVVDVERDLPRKPDVVELADTAPPKPHARAHSASVKVGNAEVTKVFALTSPTRIVVDITGGKLPKASLEPGDGVTRIRFGHPGTNKGRVVLELDSDKKPRDLEAHVDDGVLNVTFK
ncbi:MAG TPA: PilZ domain-containing protein [Byssovorax sp.]